jgi:hypothetical protein
MWFMKKVGRTSYFDELHKAVEKFKKKVAAKADTGARRQMVRYFVTYQHE